MVDYNQQHITLADDTVWQVLDAEGVFDEAATAQAIAQYLEQQNAP